MSLFSDNWTATDLDDIVDIAFDDTRGSSIFTFDETLELGIVINLYGQMCSI